MSIIKRLYNLYLRNTDMVKYARRQGVVVGDYTTISSSVEFPEEPYLIKIGNHVQVTAGVCFYTHGGGNSIRLQVPDFDAFGKVDIKDWCYLGAHSLIMPGVTIGEGSLIAAGSVVTKSVPPHTVVAGNPARIICSTEEYLQKNLKYNIGTKGIGREKKKQILLSMDEVLFIKK